MSEDIVPSESCGLSGEMVDRLMAAMGDSIRATLDGGFSVHTDLKPWKLVKGTDETSEAPLCSIDIVTADHVRFGTFVLLFDREAALRILKQHGGALDESLVTDAVCEIANMVYGAFKTRANEMGCHLVMQIPVPRHGQNPLPTSFAAESKVVLPFLAEGYSCKAMLARA